MTRLTVNSQVTSMGRPVMRSQDTGTATSTAKAPRPTAAMAGGMDTDARNRRMAALTVIQLLGPT